MALPIPRPGLVVSYEYLWADEANQGLEYGRKHRPCAVIVAVTNDGGETETIVAPIRLFIILLDENFKSVRRLPKDNAVKEGPSLSWNGVTSDPNCPNLSILRNGNAA